MTKVVSYIRVIKNTSFSHLKNSWKNKVSLDEEVVNNVKSFDEKKNDEMFEIIYNLPHKYKKVIILHYYEDLSIKEKTDLINFRFGNINNKYVIYRGNNEIVDGVNYINVEDYLNSL